MSIFESFELPGIAWNNSFGKYFVISLFVLSNFVDASATPSTRAEPDPVNQSELFEGGLPYCGVYSLYASARVLGIRLSLRDLVKPQYISSRDGSSMEDLRLAAEDHGMQTLYLSNVSISTIEYAKCPVILHVLSDSETGRYDHWVLYRGIRDGKIRIFDPPTNFRSIEAGELLERWDGNALFLSQETIPFWKFVILNTWVPIGGVICLIFVSSICARLQRKIRYRLSLGSEIFLLLTITALGCITFNVCAETGAFHRANAGHSIMEASASTLCPHLDLTSVKAAIRSGTVVVVDARYRSSFDAEHIPGAISVPPDSNFADIEHSLGDVHKNTRIIVYCDNDQCSFVSIVAGKLLSFGFRNVAIFTAGWRGWKGIS